MSYRLSCLLLGLVVLWAAVERFEPPNPSAQAGEQEEAAAKNRENDSRTVEEARGRARLMHETIHGALQVMHRDYFREGEKLTIPSESLEDVFAELTRTYGVKARWLAVDTPPMNIDHKPEDAFEKSAVKALKDGKKEFEAVEKNTYRYAGPITLSADCLKCHAPFKTNTKDRAAGLVLTLPLSAPGSDAGGPTPVK